MLELFKLKSISAILALAVLNACSGTSQHSDLRNYVAEVKQRPQGNIEPLPPVRTYEAFVYGATALRSPFEPPVDETVKPSIEGAIVEPDFSRVPDFLESYSLESLSMVGTMQQRGKLWALVKYPDGIERVTVGNFMGENHGRIISATTTQLSLIEIVFNGLGAWVERPRTIKLSEKE